MTHLSSSPLLQLIHERIRQTGPLTFAEYMRLALYEPGYGYYVNGPVRTGWDGDYFTSPDVSALFAACLGRQLALFWEKLKRPAPFRVLEQGAGSGRLAADVQAWAQAEASDLAAALVYRATDIRAGQDSLSPTEAEQQRFHILLSNELLDALPVHLVEVHQGQLYEVYVASVEGRLCAQLAAPSSPEVAKYLDEARIPWRTFPDGWRAEINLAGRYWLEEAVRLLCSHGFILTIDYGEKAARLYIPERRHGTLMCYYQHQVNEDPLARPGEQDITAHVDFSTLITYGRPLGLRLHKYTTQHNWLEDCGLSTELERRRTTEFALATTARTSDQGQIALLGWYNLRQRAAILTDPAGLGNFKVLILRR